jgi:hypothetical protein
MRPLAQKVVRFLAILAASWAIVWLIPIPSPLPPVFSGLCVESTKDCNEARKFDSKASGFLLHAADDTRDLITDISSWTIALTAGLGLLTYQRRRCIQHSRSLKAAIALYAAFALTSLSLGYAARISLIVQLDRGFFSIMLFERFIAWQVLALLTAAGIVAFIALECVLLADRPPP